MSTNDDMSLSHCVKHEEQIETHMTAGGDRAARGQARCHEQAMNSQYKEQ